MVNHPRGFECMECGQVITPEQFMEFDRVTADAE